jgi:hypothetical protein
VFYDALWKPRWLPGRLLWSLDRGSNSRSKSSLLSFLTGRMAIIHQEEFRQCHEYLLVVASKRET